MNEYSIGIDFGTSNSCMAWHNPNTGQPEVILNAEGEAKTPSLVHFRETDTLVGKPVELLLEDVASDFEERSEVFRRTVASIKRNLLFPPRIALPGGRYVRPVEVAAEVIKKLKRDAEAGHFHEEVSRAVITCPAEFDSLQRKCIEEAGYLAGFSEVALLDEPVAGALAYTRLGLKVGKHVLVYDLGGGTFDLAVLDNEGRTFRVALEPRGMDRCGGDDFDLALYNHCDEICRHQLGRPISLTGELDLKFLQRCRQKKENFLFQEKGTFSDYLSSDNGPVKLVHEVERETFENLIEHHVKTTVQLTDELVREANAKGHEVDTVVLIGGSSKVRLVPVKLGEALPVKPLEFDKKDLAVALGAACHANILWSASEPDTPLSRYKNAVRKVWTDGKVAGIEARWLGSLAGEAEIGAQEAARAEIEVMGDTKENLVAPPSQPELAPEDFVLSRTFTDHEDKVHAVAFTATGNTAISGSSDNLIRGWNADTGEFIRALSGHSGPVSSLAASPDGRFFASASLDKTVRLWRLPGCEQFGVLGHPDWVFSVAISPDGSLVASGCADSEVRIWEANTEKTLRTLSGHSHWVLSVAMSPDGKYLASSSADKTVRVWDPESGEPVRLLTGHTGWVRSVAFGGGLLASGGEDGEVRLWDIESGEVAREIPVGKFAVSSVVMSPDGRLVICGCADRKVRLWDAESGELLNILSGHSASVEAVAVSPDGRFIAGGGRDRKLIVWRKEETSGEKQRRAKPGRERKDAERKPVTEEYREYVAKAFAEFRDSSFRKTRGSIEAAKRRLAEERARLKLRREEAARIEGEVMGADKESVFVAEEESDGPWRLPDDERPWDLPD